MSRYLVFFGLAILCHAGVWAQEKPDLGGSIFHTAVNCPDKKEDICVLVSKDGSYYIFKGNVIGKEEYIWQVDSKAVLKGRSFTFLSKDITLVWTKHST